MSFSTEWEDRFKEGTQMSIWPWSDLITYVMRYAKPDKKDCKVLELGCGAGANIPFFRTLGIKYHGIDGSQTIIDLLKKKFPELKDKLKVGDFTKDIPFDDSFDLIVDRGALTHNSTHAIKQCLQLAYSKMLTNSKYIGIDWFSTIHSEFNKGEKIDDEYTKTGFKNGQFENLGKVHFSDKNHLLNLFSKFLIVNMEHKIYNTEIPNINHSKAYWNFVAVKKE